MGKQIFSAGNGGPTPEQRDVPEGTVACGEPSSEKNKKVRRKEWQREIAT